MHICLNNLQHRIITAGSRTGNLLVTSATPKPVLHYTKLVLSGRSAYHSNKVINIVGHRHQLWEA